ncbi:MAG: amino acid permease [Myxococcales bacterium]|nr:amino acid permease [Myxococcales bacterium]
MTTEAAPAASPAPATPEPVRFGTFQGVFRPTILTIIGVMLYVREGWLVGNAGLVGAFLVIAMAYVITGTVALSISSITTNIRMGQGGVFSIVAQTLGLEIGGSIGIPLYFAQGVSAAMYLHGMKEGFLSICPPSALAGTFAAPLVDWGIYESLVVLVFFGIALAVTAISTRVAFRVQYVVMAFIVVALTSMALGLRVHAVQSPQVWGSFRDGSLMNLFAVFFPAATGVMVGASMSGSLKDPRRSIPRGTMIAWVVSLVVYVGVAVLAAYLVPTQALMDNKYALIDHALWPMAVQAGLMASCFTATLSSLAAAPRVLQALGKHGVVPWSGWLQQERGGEPRNALLLTGAMVFVTVVVGDLDAIAKLLTMFFILAYFTINTVLCIEKGMSLISFRPTFRIPWYVPLTGSVACLLAMFVINPLLSLISLAIILSIYVVLDRRQLQNPFETVHSGLFGIIAHWAARRVFITDTRETKRTWKPDVLIPVERDSQLEGVFRFLRAFTWPQGSVQVVALGYDGHESQALRGVHRTIKDLQHEGIFATHAMVEALNYTSALKTCVSVMRGSFFRPNVLFVPVEPRTDDELQQSLDLAAHGQMAAVFMAFHPEAGFGRERAINVWLRDQSPNWHLGLKMTNVDMAVLLAYKVNTSWQGIIRLCCAVERPEHTAMAEQFFRDLVVLARLGQRVEVHVTTQPFLEALQEAPRADATILGLSEQTDRAGMLKMTHMTESTCFFVKDSGMESALA